jgi:hypothetical protein
MATRLMIKSTKEERFLVLFLWSKEVTASEIYGRMTIEYGDKYVAGRNSMSGWKDAR